MPKSSNTQAACSFCGEIVTRRSIAGHLKKCPKWLEEVQLAESSSRSAETLLRLRVMDAYNKDFWLELEMNGSARLDELDQYLRDIWLECCGHLSMFTIGGWSGEEIPSARNAGKVLQPGVTLRHLYDFGTTSETDIKMIDARTARPTSKHPIRLLARNLLPEILCQECGQPAKWLCLECLYEQEESGCLCDEHADDHPHDEYGEPMPICNSPRSGMCGYTGPAEPPY
jgi:hypothetical protein